MQWQWYGGRGEQWRWSDGGGEQLFMALVMQGQILGSLPKMSKMELRDD